MAIYTDAWITPRDGETEADSLTRRVKMHEFLLTGGVQIGYNSSGIMEYTSEIDPVEYGPACPWHGEGCSAWEVIFKGDSDGAGRVGPQGLTLAELRAKYPHIARADREDAKRDSNDESQSKTSISPATRTKIEQKIADAGNYAPNSVAFADDGSGFVASTALCSRHWNRTTSEALAKDAGLAADTLWGKAPRSKMPCVVCEELGEEPPISSPVSGNPWDRKSQPSQYGGGSGGYGQGNSYGGGSEHDGQRGYTPGKQGGNGFGWRRKPRLEDSRDAAVREFDSLEEPDEIIIEGDEEGDE